MQRVTRQNNRRGPHILLIGSSAASNAADADTIGCDFASVIAGPQNARYDDFDVIVFRPTADLFLLPATSAQWVKFRETNGAKPWFPYVTPSYWRFRPNPECRYLDIDNPQGIIDSSSISPEHFSPGYARESAESDVLDFAALRLFEHCHSEIDATLLERLLWWRCCLRLRQAVLSMAAGAIIVILLPTVPFDIRWCTAWLCRFIDESPAPVRSPRKPRARAATRKPDLATLATRLTDLVSDTHRRLFLRAMAPGADEPTPMAGAYQLADLIMKSENFTLCPPGSDTVETDPGWGLLVSAAHWPPTGPTVALLLNCEAGGAVICTAPESEEKVLSCLRSWHAQRTGDDAQTIHGNWMKSIFRPAGESVWEAKIKNEASVFIGNTRGCEYIHRVLKPENRAEGIKATQLYSPTTVADVAALHYGHDVQNPVQGVSPKKTSYADSHLGLNSDTRAIQEMITQRNELGARISEIEALPGKTEKDQEQMEQLLSEREAVQKGLSDAMAQHGRQRIIRTKSMDSARVSVHNAIHRVYEKLKEENAPMLAVHLKTKIQTGDTIRYTGSLEWITE